MEKEKEDIAWAAVQNNMIIQCAEIPLIPLAQQALRVTFLPGLLSITVKSIRNMADKMRLKHWIYIIM